MRVGVVDLGTNTTRLLVADVADGHVNEVARRLRITGLGQEVDARRRLLPLPIARVRNCLSDYRRELEALGAERTLAVATSAIRDAENGEAFLGEVEWSYRFTTRLLSGKEEALLTFRGATAGRDDARPTIVVDIGGGSTEIVAGRAGDVTFHDSLDIGSVRLTERFLVSDPPGARELAQCAGAVRSLLGERLPEELATQSHKLAIGVAGTVTTLAAIDLGLVEYDPARVHGHWVAAESVESELDRLAALPLAERREVAGLDPDRAPVIVAGALILRVLLRYLDLLGIEASERDLLHGAAIEAAALPEPVEGNAPPGAYTCC